MYLDRFKVIELPAPSLVHWILNPGLAINELALGQRIATRTLVDQKAEGPLFERTYLECKACGALHPSRLWAKSAVGNWFGLICPKCEVKIPTLLNAFSFILLIPTSPVWYPLKLAFEKKLHSRQLARLRSDETPIATGKPLSLPRGLAVGGVWAAVMFIFFAFVMSPITGVSLTLEKLFLMAALCAAGGVVLGLSMLSFLNRRIRRGWPPKDLR